MTEVLVPLIVGCVVGVAAGLVFFAGLAATVRRVPTARMPGALVLASTLLRLAVVAAMLTLVAVHGDWPAVVAALVGLLVVRSIMIRGTSKQEVGSP